MNWQGLLVGAFTFLIIGVFHPVVIKCEYYFSCKIWPLFLIAGIAFCAFALLVQSYAASILLGITGFTCLWSIGELKEQQKRVEKGWFPQNPNRRQGSGRP